MFMLQPYQLIGTTVSTKLYIQLYQRLDTVVAQHEKMKIEAHIAAVRESLDELKDCIAKGIESRQRTIGFHCSAAAVDLLEIFLHQQNFIEPSAHIKHNWFSSTITEAKRLPEFPKKIEFLEILNKIEKNRNLLCYGKPQPAKTAEEAILLFNKLKAELEKLGVVV